MNQGDGKAQRPSFPGARIGAAAGSLVLACAALLGLVVAGRALEMQPRFCASCHELREHHRSWLASGAGEHHRNCVECHTRPGFAGILHGQLRGAAHVVVHITGRSTVPLTATVPREWCVKCHSETSLGVRHVKSPDVSGQQCAACHNHRSGSRFGG